MIGGDPADLRALARRIRESGHDIELAAARVRRTAAVEWHSTAADAFRRELAERSRQFDEVSSRYEQLADQVDQLASTLQDRQDFLVRAYYEAESAFYAARDAVEDAADTAARETWEFAGDVAGFARTQLGRLW